MNQTQVNNFLMCLLQIDDLNYLALHAHAHAATNTHGNSTITTTKALERLDDDDDHDRDHDHDHDHGDSHDLLMAKVTAMVVLFCVTVICGSIPFLLNKHYKWTESNTNARSATVVKCLLYFGGGVLLCTTFLHLLPEVQELVEQLQECEIIPDLPFALAELLMCAGFFLMYLIEELIHTYIHRHKKRILESDAGAGAAFERGRSFRNSYFEKGGAIAPKRVEAEAGLPSAPSLTNSTSTVATTVVVVDDVMDEEENQKYENAKSTTVSGTANAISSAHNLERHDHHEQAPPSHNHNDAYNHSHNHHSHLPTGDDDMVTSSLRGLLIVLALSLHELFEGMAIGLESSPSAVWFMFGAVSAHKFVLAFCVGVELIVARTRLTLASVYVLTFGIVSPIGIGIGILISHNEDTSAPTIPSAILQGLACGTLLYVVFFEILSKSTAGLRPYFAMFVGFAVIFGLQQLNNDGHGHSHGTCSVSDSTDTMKSVLLPAEGIHHMHRNHMNENGHGHSHHHHVEKESSDNFAEQLQILRQASQNLLQNYKKTN